MLRSHISLGLYVVAALAFTACTEDAGGPIGDGPEPSESVVDQLCQRADECNRLDGSVAECVSSRNLCLQDLTSEQRADWTREIESCLSYNTCQLAIDCYFDVPWC